MPNRVLLQEPKKLKDILVEGSCNPLLYYRFHTLLRTKGIIQQKLADHLGFNKAYISRIIHGKEIPPTHIKIQIAQFFGVDSRVIWD